MELIAHRGCAGQFPENTVRAIRGSAPRVSHVELDVRRCGSGELVAFHDADLDGKTSATGAVAETDWSALRALTVGDSGEPIPLLSEALEAFPDGVGVELDLKADGAAAEAVGLATDAGVESLVLSGDRAVVSAAVDAVDAPVGYIVDAASLDAELETALEAGCAFVYVTYELCDDRALVERIHDAGLAVNAGSIREAAAADRYVDRLREAGVDYLSVDRCDWEALYP
ncbi:MAG: glycerophosphodiester phosphodiesterase [Halobacteriaceae archaeon]